MPIVICITNKKVYRNLSIHCYNNFLNMGFFDNVKNHAIKVKLQGDIVLLDREMTARKSKFGIDLYDLLHALQQGNDNTILHMPSFFNNKNNTIKQQYEVCCTDIQRLEQQIDAKKMELHHMESARERSKPAITNREMAAKASSRVSDAAMEAKLNIDITLLQRNIQQRKEKLGLDLYDVAVLAISDTATATANSPTAAATASPTAAPASPASPTKSPPPKGGIRSLLGNTGTKASFMIGKKLSKFNSSDGEIRNCILLTKRDVDFSLKQRTMKQKEIDSLVGSK